MTLLWSSPTTCATRPPAQNRRQLKMAEAKSKKRKRGDEEAIAEYEKKLVVPTKSQDSTTKHRDSVPTGQVLNIIADTIEEVFSESGRRIDRLNAKEYFAMNI